MKTKILSILALLLTVTQGAWAQLGRVLATDGKYYKTVTAATNAGTTASGMIVYWGDGDTSDNTYNQGLAIALSDVVNNGQWGAIEDVTGITDTGPNAASSMVDKNGIANTNALVSKWPTGTYSYAANHCASMSTARPSSSSNWFLPSQGQFVLMMNSYGAGYGTSTYAYDNITKGAVVTAINNALTNAGGTALSNSPLNGRYWTSTEIKENCAGDWSAFNSSFGYNDKTNEQNVRAMFAFSGATAAEYTVSYNANGGSGAPDDQTKDGGIDLTLSSTVPTRDGYTFAGWATSADGAVAYSAGGSYTTNDDIVLYAQWTPVTYTASFATGSGGTGWSISPTSDVEGATVTVSYTGQHRVKSVTAKKKAAATPTLSLTSPAVGQVIGSDGKNYAAASVPSGVTKVAMIAYVSGSNGLAIALADEGSLNWETAKSTCEAKTPAFTNGTWKLPTKDEWNQMFSANGGSEESYTGLNTTINTAGGTTLQEGALYWSSSVVNPGVDAYGVHLLYDGGAHWYSVSVSEDYGNRVRACLAF